MPIGATVRYPSAATGWGATFGGLTTVMDYSDVWTWTTDNNQVTITGYTGAGGAVVIPASTASIDGTPVTAIGENAFDSCSGLTSVTIPTSVTSIGLGAFSGCSSLTSVVIPDNVTSIGGNAFAGCSNLVSLSIGSGITSIGTNAFAGYSGITRVMIPAATALGIDAFPPTTTFVRYLTEAQMTSRDSQQNAAGQAAGRIAGRADVIQGWVSAGSSPRMRSVASLLGICFLREAPERAIGSDRRAGKWGLALAHRDSIRKNAALSGEVNWNSISPLLLMVESAESGRAAADAGCGEQKIQADGEGDNDYAPKPVRLFELERALQRAVDGVARPRPAGRRRLLPR